jgi:hypothetical protein
MPETARSIVIDHNKRKLHVDGNEFPWEIEDSGPKVATGENGLVLVTVTIIAEAVEVIPEDDHA